MTKLPKWLNMQWAALIVLGIDAAMNINVVVHDPSQWLNAGLAGAALAWMAAIGTIIAQSRIVTSQQALLRQQHEAMCGMMEIKGQEIGEALARRFGMEAAPPVTRH